MCDARLGMDRGGRVGQMERWRVKQTLFRNLQRSFLSVPGPEMICNRAPCAWWRDWENEGCELLFVIYHRAVSPCSDIHKRLKFIKLGAMFLPIRKGVQENMSRNATRLHSLLS